MAFEIIWFLVALSQFSLLVKYLRFIPLLQARAPYIMVLEMRACLLHVLTVPTAHDPNGHALRTVSGLDGGHANLLERK
jgi:hypothetical protein